ncbi:MAG: hypothetical protein DIU70_006605 [Bacillota bacterium]|nr:MAG: hypothetical protein DIU70_12360 [Bacillota bacterium]
MTDRPENTEQEGLLARVGRVLGLKESQARSIALILVIGLLGLWLLGWDPAGTADRRQQRRPPGTYVQADLPWEAGGQEPAAAPAADGPEGAGADSLSGYEARLARELEGILSMVEGAGQVRVLVRLAAGPTRVPAMEQRTTTRSIREQDAGGGTRQTTDADTDSRPAMATAAGGGSAPFVLREEGPRVEGVVVVAEGARYPLVRAELAQAAALALGVPPNRVAVLVMTPGVQGAGGGGR